MNWIKDKIKKFSQQVKKIVRSRPTAKEVTEGLFKTCPVCSKINLNDEMKKNYEICSCSYHFEISPIDRFQKCNRHTRLGTNKISRIFSKS